MKHEEWFPIQGEHGTDTNGVRYDRPAGRVPWGIAEAAYKVYARRYGRDQSLERLAARGGFGWSELVNLLVDSDECLPVPFGVKGIERSPSPQTSDIRR
jgi:hypothetical protein